ncbi:MAG: class I SAM-dependent methyltransferase [Pirellulaceae bacterium]
MDQNAIVKRNREAWQQMARHGHRLARPAQPEELHDPLHKVDSMGWLGGNIQGWQVLCLAAGGGKHGPLYAAAGAKVTVVDFSSAMLDLDREMRDQTGIPFEIIEASMDDLSMLSDAQFDLVIHPVSTCYIANPIQVFGEVARVTRSNGLYVSQHKQPTSLQLSLQPQHSQYVLTRPYYQDAPLEPESSGNLVREPATYEFIHRWETILGGICRAGFVVEDVIEPFHADPAARPGTFEHRSAFAAPYVRIKARRSASSTADPPDRKLII